MPVLVSDTTQTPVLAFQGCFCIFFVHVGPCLGNQINAYDTDMEKALLSYWHCLGEMQEDT